MEIAARSFLVAEREEASMQALLGKPVTILTETRGGVEAPLPLSELRRRLTCGDQVDMFAHGGCGCFIDSEAA